SPDLWDRQEEAVAARVPYRLLRPVLGINPGMRRVKGKPLADSQVAIALIDADQGAERWCVGVVDHQQDAMLRIIGELIRAQSRGSASRRVADGGVVA